MFPISSNCYIKLWKKPESHPETGSSIKPFINKYNWKERNYLSKIDNWKTFEKSNLTIALNFCISKKAICLACISKVNSNYAKQIILLVIPNEEKEGWLYLSVN